MKCPECGLELGVAAVVGLDNSFRCGKCGGCLVEGWVINKLAEGGGLEVQKAAETKTGGPPAVVCPADGGKMVRGEGDLPTEIDMWRCDKCGKWWLPGNTIFDVAKAFEVRREYHKLWKRRGGVTSFALPVVLTLVLVAGLGMVIREVGRRQLLLTSAAIVEKSDVRYLGNQRVEVKLLVRGDLGQVEYRLSGSREWLTASVVSQGAWQVAVVEGVGPGEKFLIRWNGGIVQLTVGEQQ